MSAQNISTGTWTRAQGTNFTARLQVSTIPSVLHSIIVNSNTGGSFRVGNGTIGNVTWPMGTYTPTTATSGVIEFDFLEFSNGILVEVGGTVNLTAVYNELV